MQNPIISIITPTYNSASFISKTIESVQFQTFSDWEMIIVDDCSTDQTVAVVAEYVRKDSRIFLCKLNTNSGAGIARNLGLSIAKGRYIAFLDSDDLWKKNKLRFQLEFMQSTGVAISFTEYGIIDTYGKINPRKIAVVDVLGYKDYLKNTIIGMSTSMIDKEIVGEFNFVNMRTRQDTYLWITLLKRGFKAYGIKMVLGYYRQRPNSISANKLFASFRVLYIYVKMEDLGFYLSSYYFLCYIGNAIKKRII